MKNKYINSLLIIILLLTISVAIYFNQMSSKTLKVQQAEIELIKEANDSLDSIIGQMSIKSEADELFIQRKFDSALLKYQFLLAGDTSRPLYQERKSLFELLSNEESQINELESLRKKQSNLLSKMQVLNDSLQAIKYEYSELKNVSGLRYRNLEQQLKRAKTDMDALQMQYNELKTNRNMISFRSSSGNRVNYLGDMESNRANGYGIGFWDTGGVYKGEWKNNRRSGKGRYEWADGEWYEGEFLNDQRNGFGIYMKRNGERYEGNWKNNKRHGEGIVYDKNEVIINQGIWNEDNFVSKEEIVNNK